MLLLRYLEETSGQHSGHSGAPLFLRGDKSGRGRNPRGVRRDYLCGYTRKLSGSRLQADSVLEMMK